MKTIVRIVTISLVLSLAGALTEAWGAQSVPSLIKAGDTALSTLQARQAALKAAVQKNHALSAQGQQIQEEQKKMQADIAAYKQKVNAVNGETAKYKKECSNKNLTPEKFKSCKALNKKINADINAVNTQPAKLKARQKAFMSKAQAYNQQVKNSPDQVKGADAAYRKALANAESWLDDARDLVASQAFQPFAKKAKCPDVQKPAHSVEGMVDMGHKVLACLKRVASSR